MPKIFLTGATGYVGGQVLYSLAHSKLSGLKISCLVRDASKIQQIRDQYPDIELVEGSLDDTKIVEREAQAADVVLNLATTGHAGSAQAIANGLQARSQKPNYWIQISGATVYAAEEIASSRYGYASETVYDDLEDQQKILSVIRTNPKRVVENLVLSQSSASVKTALIIGPLIYGVGQGPVNRRSIQAPEIAKATLRRGRGFKLNDGDNSWSNIHVSDVGSLTHALVEAALESKDGLWNEEGVYNVEAGQLAFKELDSLIAKEAQKQGLIKPDTDLETIDAATADSFSSHAAVLWGTNARTKSSRAQQKLGWSASAPSLKSEIPDMVRAESDALSKL